MKYLFNIITCISIVLSFTFSASAQDNKGKEFWFSYPAPYAALTQANQLLIVSHYDCSVTINYPQRTGAGAVTTVAVTGGIPIAVSISDAFTDKINEAETKRKNGMVITSTMPIALYALSYEAASSEICGILPIEKLGKNYITTAYRENDSATDFNSRLTIVATKNGTVVNVKIPTGTNWTSSSAAMVKRAPGSSWSVVMNKGESYSMWCNNGGNGPSAAAPGGGTFIDNLGLNSVTIDATENIVVIGGSDCTRIGDIDYPGCSACDITFAQHLPISQWDTRYVSTQTLNRLANVTGANPSTASMADYLFITAAEDGTVVNLSGDAIATINLNKGQYKNYESPGSALSVTGKFGAANHIIQSNKPIMINQLQKGFYCDNSPGGDPSQMWVFDEKSWVNNYFVVNPSFNGATYPANYIVFIVKDLGGTSTARTSLQLKANGSNVPIPTNWVKYGAEPYYWNRVAVPAGSIRITGDSVFAFYSSGGGGPGSYGYMGGLGCGVNVFASADTSNFCKATNVTKFKIDSVKNGSLTVTNPATQIQPTYKWIPNIATPGVPAPLTGASPTYRYPAPGTYTAVLEITDIGGCFDRDTFTVIVPLGVDNPIISGPAQACVNDQIALTGSTLLYAANQVNFKWYNVAVGGATLAGGNNVNPFITTLAATTTYYGEYTTIAEGCVSPRTSFTVTQSVNLANPNITGDTTICKGVTANLTSTSGIVGAQFNWYSDAAGTTVISANSNMQLVPSDPLYPVNDTNLYVKVYTANCASLIKPVLLSIKPIPGLASINGPSPICEGTTAVLTGTPPVPSAKLSWYDVPNGGIALDTSINTFTTATLSAQKTYYVESVLNKCSSASRVSKIVDVLATPITPSAIEKNICEGNSTTLTGTSPDNNVSFSWYSDAAGTNLVQSGANYTTNILNQDAVYYLKTTKTQNSTQCYSALKPILVTVFPKPKVNSWTGGPICAGNSVLLVPNVFPTDQVGYEWKDAGNSLVWTEKDFLTPDLFTTTSYFLTLSSPICGIQPAEKIEVIVNALPIATVSDLNLCEGDPIQFIVSSNEDPDVEFYWYDSDLSLIDSGSTFTPSKNETATFSVSPLNKVSQCLGDLVDAKVTVNPTQVIAIPVGDCNKILTDSSISFQWDPIPLADGYEYKINNGNYIKVPAGQFSVDINDLKPDFKYTITLRAFKAPGTFFCGNLTGLDVVLPCQTVPTTSDFKITEAFSPNGDNINDLFYPPIAKNIDEFEISIYNRWGELIFTGKDAKGGWNGKYGNTGDAVPQGVYVYTLKYRNIETGKIIVDTHTLLLQR